MFPFFLPSSRLLLPSSAAAEDCSLPPPFKARLAEFCNSPFAKRREEMSLIKCFPWWKWSQKILGREKILYLNFCGPLIARARLERIFLSSKKSKEIIPLTRPQNRNHFYSVTAAVSRNCSCKNKVRPSPPFSGKRSITAVGFFLSLFLPFPHAYKQQNPSAQHASDARPQKVESATAAVFGVIMRGGQVKIDAREGQGVTLEHKKNPYSSLASVASKCRSYMRTRLINAFLHCDAPCIRKIPSSSVSPWKRHRGPVPYAETN